MTLTTAPNPGANLSKGMVPHVRRRPRSERRTVIAMLAPAGLVLAAVFLIPLLYSLWNSFQETGTAADEVAFVGTEHYQELLVDSDFWRSVRVSVVFTAGAVAGTYALGLVTALLVDRSVPGARVLQGASIVPWAMPYVAAALLWATIFDYQYGPANWLIQASGLTEGPVGWLTSPTLALATVTFVQIWSIFPLAGVMLLAGLQSIPHERLEAASVDGASAVQRFRHIMLPGLRPVSSILILLLIVWVFGRSFTVIFVLTGGGPSGATENLVLQTYHTAFELFDLQAASALGTVILLFSLGVTLLYWRVGFRNAED